MMKRSIEAAQQSTPSLVDRLFAGGSTAMFLVIMASVIGAVSLYLR
jgi:hypothetical protein